MLKDHAWIEFNFVLAIFFLIFPQKRKKKESEDSVKLFCTRLAELYLSLYHTILSFNNLEKDAF